MTQKSDYFIRRALREAQSLVDKDEDILLTVRQSIISDIAPSFIIATNKRLIIINNSFFGLYLHRNIFTPTDYNSIYYSQITTVMLVKGKIFDSVEVRVLGAFDSSVSPQKKTEGEMDGMYEADAKALVNFINNRLSEMNKEKAGTTVSDQNIPIRLYYAFKGILHDNEIKTKEISYKEAMERVQAGKSKFIWLGSESIGYISEILKVKESEIIRMDPDEIQIVDKNVLEEFSGDIFVCYNGNLSKFVSRYLKKKFNIDTYALDGGIVKFLVGSGSTA